MLPACTVRAGEMYLFYCLKTTSDVSSSRICARVWDQKTET